MCELVHQVCIVPRFFPIPIGSFCKSSNSDLLFALILCERELHMRKYIDENSAHTYVPNICRLSIIYTVRNQSNTAFQIEKNNLTQCAYAYLGMCRGLWYMFIAHAHHFNYATSVNMFRYKVTMIEEIRTSSI